MLAKWKSLFFASIGFVSIAWLGLSGESSGGAFVPATELAMQDPAVDHGCVGRRPTPCTTEMIRYAYPAATSMCCRKTSISEYPQTFAAPRLSEARQQPRPGGAAN
jgi:hypothetical protein